MQKKPNIIISARRGGASRVYTGKSVLNEKGLLRGEQYKRLCSLMNFSLKIEMK